MSAIEQKREEILALYEALRLKHEIRSRIRMVRGGNSYKKGMVQAYLAHVAAARGLRRRAIRLHRTATRRHEDSPAICTKLLNEALERVAAAQALYFFGKNIDQQMADEMSGGLLDGFNFIPPKNPPHESAKTQIEKSLRKIGAVS